VPLKASVSTVRTAAVRGGAGAGAGYVTSLTVKLTNTSDSVLTPQFAFSDNAWTSFDWRVVSGPAMLAPHATGTYRLTRRGTDTAAGGSGTTGRSYLRVLTDDPQTLTTTLIPPGR
jgi:hypothetical protein